MATAQISASQKGESHKLAIDCRMANLPYRSDSVVGAVEMGMKTSLDGQICNMQLKALPSESPQQRPSHYHSNAPRQSQLAAPCAGSKLQPQSRAELHTGQKAVKWTPNGPGSFSPCLRDLDSCQGLTRTELSKRNVRNCF